MNFIDVKGWKAMGNKLIGFSRFSGFKVNELEIMEQHLDILNDISIHEKTNEENKRDSKSEIDKSKDVEDNELRLF